MCVNPPPGNRLRCSQVRKSLGFVLFPPPGHDVNHLRLAYDRYQEPYSKTPLNWDTDQMRKLDDGKQGTAP